MKLLHFYTAACSALAANAANANGTQNPTSNFTLVLVVINH
jgi:hypothetical protein